MSDTFDLDAYFDIIERASMSKAWEKGDEKLAGEAAAARERIREEFGKLRDRYVITGEQIPYCDDCGIRYGVNGWCDVVIPDAIWNQIAPEGGVLCFMCMTFRINKAGLKDVPVIVASGPYKDANEEWRLAGWEHGYKVAKAELEETLRTIENFVKPRTGYVAETIYDIVMRAINRTSRSEPETPSESS